jgi:hypothetical protein
MVSMTAVSWKKWLTFAHGKHVRLCAIVRVLRVAVDGDALVR